MSLLEHIKEHEKIDIFSFGNVPGVGGWTGDKLDINQSYEDETTNTALSNFRIQSVGQMPNAKSLAIHASAAFINCDNAAAANSVWNAIEASVAFDPENATTQSGSDGLGTGTSMVAATIRGIESDMLMASGDVTDSYGFDTRLRNGFATAGTRSDVRDHTAYYAHGIKSQGANGYLYNYTGFHSDAGDVAQPYLEAGGFWVGVRLTAPDSTNFADGSSSEIGLWIDGYNGGGDIVFGADKSANIRSSAATFTIDSGTKNMAFGGSGAWTANGAQTITISNVGPAGIGTATISKWLTVRDDAGVVHYIPAWT